MRVYIIYRSHETYGTQRESRCRDIRDGVSASCSREWLNNAREKDVRLIDIRDKRATRLS